MNIYGNVYGIKKSVLWRIQSWEESYDRSLFIDRGLLDEMIAITHLIGREICVFLSRTGRLLAVGIGDSTSVPLKDLTKRRGQKRLNGVRCIHTHPNCTGKLSDLDVSALEGAGYDCMAAVGVQNAHMIDMEVAYLNPQGVEKVYIRGKCFKDEDLMARIEYADNTVVRASAEDNARRTLLVHVSDDADVQASLDELAALAKTMGYETIDRVVQKRSTPDRATMVGSGKVQELAMKCQVGHISTVLFDQRLSGVQYRNLEAALGRRILDRTTLILDIFAKHATTNEGKMQVELAMLQHRLQMVTGQNEGMSRQRGGLHAMGGAGETKAETDRRAIRRQIVALKEKLEKLKLNRDERRQTRQAGGMKNVVIVGYTNAGKSTLMNYVTKAGVLEEDKLFATLDSVSRTVWDEGKRYMLTDTVGFIRRLPHEFVEAFKSTLDEARYADLLLHVVDASDPHLVEQYEVVLDVLGEIGANAPIITVYNKCDKGTAEDLPKLTDSVVVSARTGQGIDVLRRLIKEKLFPEENQA